MGRELCISLTAVVLEAINTVEQAQLQSHSSESQQNPLQLNDPNDQSITQQQPQPQRKRAVTADKRRPSSERFSRGTIAAESLKLKGGGRARAGSECNGKPQRRGAAGDRGVAVDRTFHKEDPGLKDLDQREEEFRKVRCRRRCGYFDRGLSDGAHNQAVARNGFCQSVFALACSCKSWKHPTTRATVLQSTSPSQCLDVFCRVSAIERSFLLLASQAAV